VHSDEEIENVRPNGQIDPATGKVVSPAKAIAANQRSPVNTSAIEEDIAVDTSIRKSSKAKDVSHDGIDEEIDYDDDFEEASGDEEEYKPKIAMKPIAIGGSNGPSPEPVPGARGVVSVRPDTAGIRSQTPPVNSGRDPLEMEDIKKAMENEKRQAQAQMGSAALPSDNQSHRRGVLAEYECTMPKFNLTDGTKNASEKASLQRLRDLKRMKFLERRTVEKIDLFSQRPQTAHSLFLANKSLKYHLNKTVSCQTREDDVEIGTMTDEIFTEDKEMQFPTLTMGQSAKAGSEPSQMLPFLRRTLPLFEASMAEGRHRQLPMLSHHGAAAESQPQERVMRNSTFGLPDSFISRCIDAHVNIADIAVCPEWYGADHTLVLYTWAWKQRPPPDSGLLDAFTRPMQSLIALYPILSGSEGNIIHPARCLYSFCRLSSLVVVGGRSHIVVAGSEMGSLLVWDLREKAKLPTEHNKSGADSSVPAFEPDPDMAHFQGALWLGAAFSTDSFTMSSAQAGGGPDAEGHQGEHEPGIQEQNSAGTGVHNVEISCVRCSSGAGSDPLIFALDLMGTVSFWRVLEFASMQGTQVKLALQGSVSLPASIHSVGNFVDATGLCIHPQQQMQFVVVATSGVHQAHRHQRTSSVSDGPGTFELLGSQDEDGLVSDGLGSVSQACSAAFNPFFPGLLLVAYAEGDLALFDCTMCVPATHWSGAVTRAPNLHMSVAWSPVRPCVFFVKSLDVLDIWDLAEKSYAPIDSVDLSSILGPQHPGLSLPGGISSELYVTSKGHPVVAYSGKTVCLSVPSGLTAPLQVAPPRYVHDERAIDTLLVSGREETSVFPTLERYSRKIDIPQAYSVERDVMRRIVAGLHPLQAWT